MALSRRRSALIRRLHRPRSRRREGLFLVEGVRGVVEALDGASEVRFLLRSPRLDSLIGREVGRGGEEDDGHGDGDGAVGSIERAEATGLEVERVTDEELAEVADTETHQGILAVCAEPGWSLEALGPGEGRPRVLVLDAVQDPGNVGALVRVAAAFGLDGVVALDGSADPWSPKAVRASAGGLFRARVVVSDRAAATAWLDRAGLTLLAAEAGGEEVGGVDPGPGWALALGNEGAGLGGDLLARAERRVSVPTRGGVESLNVATAGAVLVYALTRSSSGPSGEVGR